MRLLKSTLEGMSFATAFSRTASANAPNMRPIIGILTQPMGSERNSTNEDAYIAASYVKFVEMAGGRAVPVFHYESNKYLTDTFNSINGLLMPGGGSNISSGSTLRTTGAFLYDLALNANDNGDTFPIWGTCMGFQFLTMLTAQDDSVLCSDCFTTEGEVLPLNFTSLAQTSKLYAGLASNQPDIFAAAATESLTANSHHDGIFASTYEKNDKLREFYNVLSTNTDPSNGRVFASSIEAKSYPVLATQWHPEKSNFEWLGGKHVNHSVHAVRLSQYVADTFVELARQNTHSYPSQKDENAALIYNYSPISDPNGYFQQIYKWDVGTTEPAPKRDQ